MIFRLYHLNNESLSVHFKEKIMLNTFIITVIAQVRFLYISLEVTVLKFVITILFFHLIYNFFLLYNTYRTIIRQTITLNFVMC